MPIGTAVRTTAVNLPTTTLTAVLSITDAFTGSNSTIYPVSGSGSPVIIDGTANVTAGTATTLLAVSCKDQNGIQIGTTQNVTVAGGNSYPIPFTFVDQRNLLGPNTYTINMQQTSATGNGTVNEIVITTKTTG